MKSFDISPVILSPVEKRSLDKYWFTVIHCIWTSSFFIRCIVLSFLFALGLIPYSVLSFILSVIISVFFSTISNLMQFFLIIWLLVYTLILIVLVIWYLRWKYLFLSENWAIAFFKKYKKWEIWYLAWYNIYNTNIIATYSRLKSRFPKIHILSKVLVAVFFLGVLMLISAISDNPKIILLIWMVFLGFLTFQVIFFLILLCVDKLFLYFYPLMKFWALWSNIQSLTPKIEEQSKKIQSEFQSDMNFSVLSQWFDSLSSTFSQIIILVLELEKIEARANKWNLFDSEKYINSLRLDIVEPLQSLKEFLEIQKTKLLDSQKELTRVRVGGEYPEINSGWQENIELQSKRGESMITELTENIEKLNVMIGKMGK